MVEAMNLAVPDRNALLGDPRLSWRCPGEAAQLPRYASVQRARIQLNRP